MKVQCDVCEKAVASVMCCADEAALCLDCDTRVHAANKLANKHQRVSLIPSAGASPRCDICQERFAFFFCLEDRALLCRDCDVSIHSANALSSGHQRFLVPGTKVALEALNGGGGGAADTTTSPATDEFSAVIEGSSIMKGPPPSALMSPSTTASKSSSGVPNGNGNMPSSNSPITSSHGSALRNTNTPSREVAPSAVQVGHPSPGEAGFGGAGGHGGVSSSLPRKPSITEFLTEAISSWRVDELLNIPDLADGYNIGDVASSKADMENLGDYDWTADLSLFDEQVTYADSFHEVPRMNSQPTAVGVMGGGSGGGNRTSKVSGPTALKGKAKQSAAMALSDYDDTFVVPELGHYSSPASPPVAKRRRQQFVQV